MVQISNRSSKTVRKRLEILRGAAEAFRRRGFDGAGMREIASAIGMVPGALYYYFKSKDDLLYFVQDYSVDRLLEIGKRVSAKRAPADRRLAELVREQVRTLLDDLQGTSAHLDFHALPPRLLRRVVAKRDQFEAIVRGIIGDGVRARTFRRVDPKLAALAVLGAVNWTVRWYRPEGAMRPDAIGDQFADLLIRGLLK